MDGGDSMIQAWLTQTPITQPLRRVGWLLPALLLGLLLALLVAGGLLAGSVPSRQTYARGYGGGWGRITPPSVELPAAVGTIIQPLAPGPTALAIPQLPQHANLLDHQYHITSEFGRYPNGRLHYGLDLDAWLGTVVHAPVGGTITAVQRGCVAGDQGCGTGWGTHVWFQSAETGHYVLIGHFQRLNDWVQEGATFTAGAPFGESGSTGYSSGPHVHLQVNPGQMGNPGSTNPAWEFPWLHCAEPLLGALFGAACP